MSDWKIDKLENLFEITSSKRIMRSEYQSNGIPFYRSKEIIEKHNGNNISTELFISRDKYLEIKNKFGVPTNGDILLTSVGTLGIPYIVKNNEVFYFKDGNLTWFRNYQEKINNKFIYYWLISPIGKNKLKEITIGSTQPALTIIGLKNIEISYPNIVQQNRIIERLEYLDKKIQFNTQINQTLENIAQAIFKSWFIDFDPVRAKATALADGLTPAQAERAAMSVISGKNAAELDRLQADHPEQYQQLQQLAQAFPSEFEEVEGFGDVPRGWKIGRLVEICSMKNGYAFKSSDWTEQGIPVIKIGSVKPMIVEIEGNGFVSEENAIQKSDFLLKAGDIVVGLTGYVGEVGRIPYKRKAMLNQRVAKFIPQKINKDKIYYSFVYCLSRQIEFKQYAESNAKGSAQANISTKELLDYPICIGDMKIHILFEEFIQPILDKILVNSGNNETLAKTRNNLLPKLLSGEIRV